MLVCVSTVDTTSTTPATPTAVPPQADRRAPRRARALDTTRPSTEGQRTGEICPTCFMAKSLAGTCDTCD